VRSRPHPRPSLESAAVRSQAELYRALAGEVDDELSWSESELPEHQRTKHVHRLHPYLGKFVPQLVEVFLQRLFRPGQRVLDPFAGSGTTLAVAKKLGRRFLGAELSEEYADGVRKRLQMIEFAAEAQEMATKKHRRHKRKQEMV
jgi:tRNA G10  N-methylase Trm11